ncbi:MAG: aminopeptidase [Cytophagales bacterium]|nr:aminopeptidase [Cytophagales bacterium]
MKKQLMSFVKKIFVGIGFAVIIFLLINYDLVMYGIRQGKGQLEIIRNARPNNEVLDDPNFPDSLKANLKLVGDIKKFAFDSLGINFSKNYSKVYDQKGKELMFVVTACKPYKLEPKEWKFPLIGSFSYKGFFDRERAQALESKLIEQGYDTNIRTAGGWSTLGWFEDPILSNMLNDSEADFAELIIHELTHGTLFVKDSIRFNENLATFIGIKGAEKYLRWKYGDENEKLTEYQSQWNNRNLLSKHIVNGARYLNETYLDMSEDLTIGEKEKIKRASIDMILSTMDTLNLSNKPRYLDYYKRLNPNNTFFMSYLRYRGDLDLLENELTSKYNGDIKKMLVDYKLKFPSL